MALNNNDQIRIREFLLGKLDADEQQQLEEQLMVDDDLFEEFEISKGELVEEYCANELTQEEHRWFEHHFLASPEGRERYTLALALNHLQRKTPDPPSLWDKLKALFKQHPSVIALATTAAVVVMVGGVYLLRPAGETVVGPRLASNIINREQGPQPAKVKIPADAAAMKFPLSLPHDAPAGATYRAELDNKSDVTPVKVVERENDVLWVVIPVSQLPPGEYSLKLVAIIDGAEREVPGDYLFNIE